MASLTPLSKGLIGLAVVGAMASAVWHLALKEHFNTPPSATAPSAQPAPSEPPSPSVTPTPSSTPPPPSEAPAANHNGGLSPAEHAEKGRQLIESGDFAQARTHLEQAVQGGDAGAACHLGEMTLKGQGGITADQAAAAQLFQLAQSRNAICFAPSQ
jgi:cytoskeletal protein RodZ